MQSERSDSENGKVGGGRRGRGWASSKNLRRTSSIAAVAFAPHLLLSACLPVDDKWERERPLSFPYMKHETVYERARVHEGVVHVARVNFGPRVIALRPPTSFHAPSFRPPFLIPFSPSSLFSSSLSFFSILLSARRFISPSTCDVELFSEMVDNHAWNVSPSIVLLSLNDFTFWFYPEISLSFFIFNLE